jgi:LuxR family transcriptional regulator, maltose regulon positive regulatory protein
MRATATDSMPPASFAATRANAGEVARPALFGLLERAARVTLVSAPAGSGKTVLLRSWIQHRGLEGCAAWISVERNECDAQKFWANVVDGLRATAVGSALLQTLEPAPSFDGWAIVERLLKDLAALDDRVWMVINDLHELGSDEALRQLELLLLRAPEALRFVVLTRRDLRLGLHRLRLEGELTEIRAEELRFTSEEARLLFNAAGLQLSESAIGLLVERTEGWVAGLRLAALSLARHPKPERFAADFSGSERTVAEYLLAEVLEREEEAVRRLLLRTSVLEQVSGPLADALTGGSGGERILQDLEDANAFVVSVDRTRTWFRYHHLFSDLLKLELRRTAAAELPALHATAAGWYSTHGHLVEAIRHTQAAGQWRLAAQLLSDHYFTLQLDGQGATAHELLGRFPTSLAHADAELAALAAADELYGGSLDDAERYLAQANRTSESVPENRRARFEVLLAIVRLSVARQRGDVSAVINESGRLLAAQEQPNQLPLGDDRRAFALVSLGVSLAVANSNRDEEAERHLEQGVTLSRRIGRPYLQVYGLAYLAILTLRLRSHAAAVERAMQAVDLARKHGWSEELITNPAYRTMAAVRSWQGRFAEADEWLELASRILRTELDPAQGLAFYLIRGRLELFRGRYAEALAALEAAERVAKSFAKDSHLRVQTHSAHVLTLVKLSEMRRIENALAELTAQEPQIIAAADTRLALAALQLAQGDPQAASDALAPLLNGALPPLDRNWLVLAFLLDAIARNALDDPAACECALENALDLAEPDGVLSPFLLYPVPDLLQRHRGRRTTHAALISEILDRLCQAKGERTGSPQGALQEPLRKSELRVLRYLPTNLSAAEIAGELNVSVHTVKTHMRHLYAKFAVHERSAAIKHARALGLLAPSSRGP